MNRKPERQACSDIDNIEKHTSGKHKAQASLWSKLCQKCLGSVTTSTMTMIATAMMTQANGSMQEQQPSATELLTACHNKEEENGGDENSSDNDNISGGTT